jgi:hypothetical protein
LIWRNSRAVLAKNPPALRDFNQAAAPSAELHAYFACLSQAAEASAGQWRDYLPQPQ